MGYRNNSRGNQYRPRPPKGPVKLAFGIVADKNAPQTQAPVPLAKPPEPLARQEIVGTLTLKKVDTESSKPLPAAFVERIQQNLKRLYEEGKFTNSKSILDFKDNELHVSFAYDQTAVDRIKGLDRNERAWDPDLKCWRVFVGAFDDIFDILGRGVKLTDEGFAALSEFVNSKYYAYVAKGKLGKLIVRESWLEELDFTRDMPLIETAHGSNAQHQQIAASAASAASGGIEKAPSSGTLGEPTDARVPAVVLTPSGVDLASVRAAIQKFPFKRKPYSHQLSGIEYLLVNSEAALLDEMGCGKSFQIASALGIMLERGEIHRALVVAPMSLVKTWQEELRMATDEPFAVIGGTPSQRAKAIASEARIFVIHYEGLRLEEKALSEWLSRGQGILVFDESQRIKNLNAQTTQAALKLRPLAERCVIATGTPIANRPLDLFSQYLVMDKGRTFGVRYPAFKNTFCDMEVQKIQVGRKTIRVERFLGVRNSEELRSRIMKTSLRRLKSEVLDLPPVIYKDFVVELKAEQRTMYQQMRDTLKIMVSKMASHEVISEASTIMVQLLRLSQIASNPLLLDPGYKGSNAKLSELEDLLEDIFADDTKKVILWSHYVGNVVSLVEHFNEKYQAVGHTGEMDINERAESVKAFQDDPATRLFVATPQSAKEGLTLLPRDGRMQADTMIYLDLSFDSGSYVQSQARFHRIGQNAERCLVIHLVGESTVDEYIRKSVIEKIRTATALLDDTGRAGANLEMIKASTKFTKEDLLKAL